MAKTASPGPVVPVPTLGSWIEEDLGPVMTEKPKTLVLEPDILYKKLKNQKHKKTHEKSKNFQDSRVGTDTPGPGEAVFAIRFNGKPPMLLKT